MKSLLRVLMTLGVLIGASGGCTDLTEPTASKNVPTPPPPPASDPVNTAPRAYAGRDVWVPFPVDSVVLSGFAVDSESNITGYEWKRLSGPASYSVDRPNSLHTRVTHLEQGVYEFEFTVTDAGGLSARDTVGIFVFDPLITMETELILRNLRWGCPMSCSLEPIGRGILEGNGVPVRVFLNGWPAAGGWVEVPPVEELIHYSENENWLVYGVTNGDLWIHAGDAVGDTDVKVVFMTTRSSGQAGGPR
jgi:hypothetical protein